MYTTPAMTELPAPVARKVAYLTARRIDLQTALVVARYDYAHPPRRTVSITYHRSGSRKHGRIAA